MVPDWLRFLTTAVGLAVSLGFYGAPTQLRISPLDGAGVSLQDQMTAEADSTGDSGTDNSGGTTSGGVTDFGQAASPQHEVTADTDSAPEAPSTDESEAVSDESEESEAEGE
jgi:hypothetical protein